MLLYKLSLEKYVDYDLNRHKTSTLALHVKEEENTTLKTLKGILTIP